MKVNYILPLRDNFLVLKTYYSLKLKMDPKDAVMTQWVKVLVLDIEMM